jgi:hypothetical protein
VEAVEAVATDAAAVAEAEATEVEDWEAVATEVVETAEAALEVVMEVERMEVQLLVRVHCSIFVVLPRLAVRAAAEVVIFWGGSRTCEWRAYAHSAENHANSTLQPLQMEMHGGHDRRCV